MSTHSSDQNSSGPLPWRFPPQAIAIRLFLTCWIIYTLHFSTNIVREIYLALAIAEHFSFRVDEYANMHDDIFEKEAYGWHVMGNPGVSMMAALPYTVARPVIEFVVQRVQRARVEIGQLTVPEYNAPRDVDRSFYRKAWQRGLDLKLGLAAFVMQSLCMAIGSALGVVMMFYLLRWIFNSDRLGFWLSLLYAFGTPVFFRTGFLNHNLMMGHIAFSGFVLLWNPGPLQGLSSQTRFLLAGLAGGAAVLLDYSGLIFLFGLLCYGLVKRRENLAQLHVRWYLMGALLPLSMLLFYQWMCFGNPFYPSQHWIEKVEWSNIGYKGYSAPQLELFLSLGFHYQYGLFTSCPLLGLSMLGWIFYRTEKRCSLEVISSLLMFLGLWIFFSGVNYTRWQFNTGVRYLAPAFPFLFMIASMVLIRLPRKLALFLAAISAIQAWSFAMYRDVAGGQVELYETSRGFGVLDPVIHVFVQGFQLPFLTTIYRIENPYLEYLPYKVSVLSVFFLTGACVAMIWRSKPWYGISRRLPSGNPA